MKKYIVIVMGILFFSVSLSVCFADVGKKVSDIRLAELAACGDSSFYISTQGNDSWSGRLAKRNADGTDGPFRTFKKAQSAVRDLKKKSDGAAKTIVVAVCGGIYELEETLTFTKEDSGSDQYPVIWRAMPKENVRLIGGKFLRKMKRVKDPEIKKLLNAEVCDKIVQVDLKEAGITKYGEPSGGSIEPFFNNKPMQISRYPNDGFMTITAVAKEGVKQIDVRGTKGIAEGFFQTDDKRILNWKNEKDLYVHGYWFWDWSEQRHKVVSIDPETLMIKVAPPYHSFGYRPKQWFYAFNLLSEIDKPGEYYIDREKGILYFYPPDKVKRDSLIISLLGNAVQMNDVSNLIFTGFTVEAARGGGIIVNGGKGDLIAGCSIRNVTGTGISISGTDQTVFGCHLYQLGSTGISLNGGDRKSLTPGRCSAINNDVHDYALIRRVYCPGITTSGVGNLIAHNRVTDAPHMGMGFGGNDHVIEYNELANVCFESNDAGAIYTGRNWTMRGNILRYNYLHDISGFRGRGCVGIYLDDMFSSADLIGNLFVNVTRAAMIGGGRDCHVINNIFVNCKPSLHVDARALGWCYAHADGWLKEAKEKGTLSGIKFDKPPYSEKYPELANILQKEPKAPEGNVIERNIAVGGTWDSNKSGQWQGTSIEKKARPYLTMKDNFVEGDPMFVDAAKGDYRLKPESPAFKIGFKQLPLDKIGLFDHPFAVKR